MGCGSSSTQNHELKQKMEMEIQQKKRGFLENIQVVRKLCDDDTNFKENFKELINGNHDKFEETYISFWKEYEARIIQMNFTKDTFKDISQSISSQAYIEDVLSYMEWEVHEIIKDFSRFLQQQSPDNLKDEDINMIEKMIQSFENVYPNKQKGIIYYIENLRSECFCFGHINSNLKYNHPDFELQVFNIGIFDDFVENIEFLKDLAEIIILNRGLHTVLIQVIDNFDEKPIDRIALRNLTILFDAIKKNENIKVLVVSLVKGGEMINLGKENLQAIAEIMQLDRLMGIYFLKLSFSDEFGKNMMKILPNLQNLRFFGLTSSDKEFNYLFDIYNGISKNTSLLVVFIQKLEIFQLDSKKQEELKRLIETNKNLKIYRYFPSDDH